MPDFGHIPFAGCFSPPEMESGSNLVMVGIPDDSFSSFKKGARLAPDTIRSAYDGRVYNSTTETGVNLSRMVQDRGNILPADSPSKSLESYRKVSAELASQGRIPFFVGGDHAVTVPLVDGFKELGKAIQVIQIDAHPDLYPEYSGSPDSHACTAARILEMDHVGSITQIGIRCLNEVQDNSWRKHRKRLKMIPASEIALEIPEFPHLDRESLVYLTIDLDGIDPAFAPGVSHPVPGGLTSRQVLNLFHRSRWKLIGMDVVEVNPREDLNDRTSILAARLLHEGMGYAYKRLLQEMS